MADFAVEIEGLRKVYPAQGREGEKVALEGLDLGIPEGCIFGLLGPNGAGKSTTINILAGLTVKSAGRVRIWGFDQDVNARQARAAIGVVPQELNMDPFSVRGRRWRCRRGSTGCRSGRGGRTRSCGGWG
jgi:ABC-2 type transport system ATP-binding protein